jgi:hypothetical protein
MIVSQERNIRAMAKFSQIIPVPRALAPVAGPVPHGPSDSSESETSAPVHRLDMYYLSPDAMARFNLYMVARCSREVSSSSDKSAAREIFTRASKLP